MPSRSASGSKGRETRGRSSCIWRIASFLPLGYGLRLVPAIGRGLVEPVGAEVVRRSLLLHHVEVDADLEEADGGHDAGFHCPGLSAHVVGRGLQIVIRGNGQGEPEVVIGAFAGVVVTDAGVAVDFHRCPVQLVRLVGHRYQRSLVAQTPGVEYGAYLTQDILPPKLGEPRQHILLGGFQLFRQVQIGLLHHGERALNQVEQLAVGHVHSHTLGPLSGPLI